HLPSAAHALCSRSRGGRQLGFGKALHAREAPESEVPDPRSPAAFDDADPLTQEEGCLGPLGLRPGAQESGSSAEPVPTDTAPRAARHPLLTIFAVQQR